MPVETSDQYTTQLAPSEETEFQKWKAKYAPKDSGYDYDLRGAFKSGLKPNPAGHWPDTYKKPNHPTFSNESKYATPGAPHWEGPKGKEKLVPSGTQTPQDPFSRFSDDDKFSIARQLIQLRDSGKLNDKSKTSVVKAIQTMAPSLQKAQATRSEIGKFSGSAKGFFREADLGILSGLGAPEKPTAKEVVGGFAKGVGSLFEPSQYTKYDPTGGGLIAAGRLTKGTYESGKEGLQDIYQGFNARDLDKIGHGVGRTIATATILGNLVSPKVRALENAAADRIVQSVKEPVADFSRAHAETIVNKFLEIPKNEMVRIKELGQHPGRAVIEDIPVKSTIEKAQVATGEAITTLRGEIDSVTDQATRSGQTVDLTTTVPDEPGAWQRFQGAAPASRQLSGTVDPNAPTITGARTTGMRVSNVVEQALMEDMNRAFVANNERLMSQLQTIHDRLTTDPRTGSQRNLARMSPTEVKTLLRSLDDEINYAKEHKSPVQDALSQVRHAIGERFHHDIPQVTPLDRRASNLLTLKPLLAEKAAGIDAGITGGLRVPWTNIRITNPAFVGILAPALWALGHDWLAAAAAALSLRSVYMATPSTIIKAKVWNAFGDLINKKITPFQAEDIAHQARRAASSQGGTTGGIGRPPAPSAPRGGPGPGLPSGPAAGPSGGGQGSTAPPPPSTPGGVPGAPSPTSPGALPAAPGNVSGLPPYRMGGVEVKTAPAGASGLTEPAVKSGAERQAKYRASEKGRVKEPVKGEAAEIAISKEAKAPGASAQEKLEAMDVGLQALELKYGPRGKQIANAIRLLYKGKRIALDAVLDAIENANQKLSRSPQ